MGPFRTHGLQFIPETWGNSCRGGNDMLDGIMVPILAIVILAALWIIVIYGSSYFGPKTD